VKAKGLTIHGHLIDLGRVVQFNVTENPDIIAGDEVDGYTLSSETTTSTNTVDIVLTVGG
jgi:hypothetical protein